MTILTSRDMILRHVSIMVLVMISVITISVHTIMQLLVLLGIHIRMSITNLPTPPIPKYIIPAIVMMTIIPVIFRLIVRIRRTVPCSTRINVSRLPNIRIRLSLVRVSSRG